MTNTVAVYTLILSLLNAMAYGIVWNARILVPNETTVWQAGQNYTVEWDTVTSWGQPIPENVTGIIKLGYLEDGSIDEHLYWDLASGFPLNSGGYNISLPSDLKTMSNYIIVLMGDSGNASPKFTINGTSS